MVLADGKIAEIDTPLNLINNPNSLFYSIVIENGQDYL